MTRPDTLPTLVRILEDHLGLEPGLVTPASTFTEDLHADSLDLIELVMAAEEAFGIEIADAEAEACITVQDLLDTIATKLPPAVAA